METTEMVDPISPLGWSFVLLQFGANMREKLMLVIDFLYFQMEDKNEAF